MARKGRKEGRLTDETDKAYEWDEVQEFEHEEGLDELKDNDDVHEGAASNGEHCGNSEVESAEENVEKQECLCSAGGLEFGCF